MGWLVVLVVLSAGLTIWWNFRGREIFALNTGDMPVAGNLDNGYYNPDDLEETYFNFDPKEQPQAEETANFYDPLLEYRLSRDIARENAKLDLEKLAYNGNLDASLELLSQNKKVNQEEELESILKAKGYGETVISIEEGKVLVVAKSLTKDKVEAIGEILFNMTTFNREQIVLTSIWKESSLLITNFYIQLLI